MGPPGAGKGTMARMLSREFGMAHLSSGDIFRAEQASGSRLGAELGRYMKSGQLVPDETVVAVMAKAILASDAPGGLVLDGFPRTLAQAKALDWQLTVADKPLDAVVVLKARDEVTVERNTGRRVNLRTGTIYHVRNAPPRVPGIDDETGERLVQREDDREDVVRRRLKVYHRQTEPLIAYYRACGRVPLVEIDANGPVNQVHAALVEAVQGLGVKA